jgi:predicted transcriptional regulator
MTLRRTIHRREARKRAKARKAHLRLTTDLDRVLRQMFEDYVREQVKRGDPLYRLFYQ